MELKFFKRGFIYDLVEKGVGCIVLLQLLQLHAAAQDSLKVDNTSLRFLVDTYYGYDFSRPVNHEKPSFFYSHNRHNEFNVNLALVNFSYKDSTTKANIGIMAGTYPQYNLAAEPGLLKHIYEANVGIKISRNNERWVEAGIFPSHIGFESAISMDCWTLTRSIMAENSPYYEAGLKLSSRSKDSKMYWAAMLLNGWQRITRAEGNNGPAFGTQFTFSPRKNLTINSSTYVGAERPDTARQWRYFHDLYAIWQISNHWAVTFAFDVGIQQKMKGSRVFNSWYTPLIILRSQQENWAFAARVEYYKDKMGVIIPVVNSKFFGAVGVSLNADHKFSKDVLWRFEGRWLNTSPAYFVHGSDIRSNHFSMTSSLSISLQK